MKRLSALNGRRPANLTHGLAGGRSFTPTSASWLNLVEGWFALLTNRRLKPSSQSACSHSPEPGSTLRRQPPG